jgi:hypothetical protein
LGRFWLAALLLAGCSFKGDLDKTCEIATALKAQPPSSFIGQSWTSERIDRWYVQTKEAARSSGFKRFLEASAANSACDRYRLMRDEAAHFGIKSWSCPALETVSCPPDRDLERFCSPGNDWRLSWLVHPKVDSAPVREAWLKALKSPPEQAIELLKPASEWPEKTFAGCAALPKALAEMAAVPGLRDEHAKSVIDAENPR